MMIHKGYYGSHFDYLGNSSVKSSKEINVKASLHSNKLYNWFKIDDVQC